MGTKTIAVSEDIYRRLLRMKGPSESFTDVMQRLTRRQDLNRFIGCISDEFAEELEASVRESREEIARAFRERERRLAKE